MSERKPRRIREYEWLYNLYIFYYEKVEGKLKKTKLDLEILETAITNLHGKEGLEKVKSFISQVKDFINKTYENPDNKKLYNLIGEYATLLISKGGFMGLSDNVEKISMYLETDLFRLLFLCRLAFF